MARLDFRLYLVTDRKAAEAAGRTLPAVLAAALARAAARGARVGVQLREKDLDGGPLFALAREVRAVTRDHGARLLVNDRLDVAIAAEADGVHLPARGLPPDAARKLLAATGLVGVSTHSAAEAAAARDRGADFVVLGPVYEPTSKRAAGPPLGVAALAGAVGEAGLPVLALGGLTPERVAEVVQAGAHGVACIGAVMAASDPAAAVDRFLDALEAHTGAPA
ncbi:MAG TPA: thiamine phosphate synthase [Thermodesulfobacteriota bacterium]